MARNNRVHVSTISDVEGIGTNNRTVEIEVPKLEDNTHRVWIRNTYPANYNFVVENMNFLARQNELGKSMVKWYMRGGHFLLYRYVVFFVFIICLGFGITSLFIKPFAAIPFVLSFIHIALAIYNIVIFRINRPLLHSDFTFSVPESSLEDDFHNRFFRVSFETSVIDVTLAALIVDPYAYFTALRQKYTNLDELQVMAYDGRYLPHTYFPKESVVYLIIFLIMFVLSIFFVATKVS